MKKIYKVFDKPLLPIALLLFCVLIFLSSCSSSHLEDCRERGREVTKILLSELKEIKKKEDLSAKAATLKSLFNELVDRMIEGREILKKSQGIEEIKEFSRKDLILSQELRMELKRIYQIEGGRECIEKFQEGALLRLDAYEKLLEKQQKLAREQ